MSEEKKKVGYWTGVGTIGPGIKYGEPIFEGIIDCKTIEAQKKLGNIQEHEISITAQENFNVADKIIKDQKDEIAALKKMIQALENDNKKLKKKIQALESESEEVLKAELEKLKGENAKLKKGMK